MKQTFKLIKQSQQQTQKLSLLGANGFRHTAVAAANVRPVTFNAYAKYNTLFQTARRGFSASKYSILGLIFFS